MSEKYFQGLNYSLANEDTWIEYKLLPENVKSVFTVCGSGSRAIPFLAKNPGELHVVDLSDAQLRLFRLRLEAIKKLHYQEFLFFLGYLTEAPTGYERKELFIRFDLPSEDKTYWQSHVNVWNAQGFIYLGKWERHFMMLGKIFQKVTLAHLLPLFDTKSFAQQQTVTNSYWKSDFFKVYTKIVMNEWVANKLLYKGHFAGGKDKKTMDTTAAQYVFQEFDDLFKNTWVKANYFLQMIFLNKVLFKEAFPCECNEEIFHKVKASQTKIYYHQQDLLKLLNDRPHDFYSLSDTFSYMSDDAVKDFLTTLPSSIATSTKMVIRTFMRKPTFSISSPWMTNVEENLKAAKDDCTRMYEFTILEKA